MKTLDYYGHSVYPDSRYNLLRYLLVYILETSAWRLVRTDSQPGIRSNSDVLQITHVEAEMQMIRTCSEIVSELVKAHEEGRDVSLNSVRAKVSKRYKLKVMPRLVDIISAVPENVKELLLPKLRAKPVRTASGVSGSGCILQRNADRAGFV